MRLMTCPIATALPRPSGDRRHENGAREAEKPRRAVRRMMSRGVARKPTSPSRERRGRSFHSLYLAHFHRAQFRKRNASRDVERILLVCSVDQDEPE